jgi:hypothetical protein
LNLAQPICGIVSVLKKKANIVPTKPPILFTPGGRFGPSSLVAAKAFFSQTLSNSTPNTTMNFNNKVVKLIAATVAVTAVAIAIAAGVKRSKQATLGYTSASFASGGKGGKGVVAGKTGKGSKAGVGKADKPSAAPSVSVSASMKFVS